MTLINPTNVFEYKLEELFKKKDDTEIEIIFQTISLILYNTSNNIDMIELYKLLGLDNFVKILSLFDGRTVKFPSKEYMKNMLLLSLLYYYKEIEGLSWDEIKKEFPFDISSISYGIQIKNLNNFVRQKMEEILKRIKKKKEEKKKNEEVEELLV